jgi:hypothetical protein
MSLAEMDAAPEIPKAGASTTPVNAGTLSADEQAELAALRKRLQGR